ncbi:unnamed protein product [Victoria cruziana]
MERQQTKKMRNLRVKAQLPSQNITSYEAEVEAAAGTFMEHWFSKNAILIPVVECPHWVFFISADVEG